MMSNDPAPHSPEDPRDTSGAPRHEGGGHPPGVALCLGAAVHDHAHQIGTLEGVVLDTESRRITLLVVATARRQSPGAIATLPAAAVEWVGAAGAPVVDLAGG